MVNDSPMMTEEENEEEEEKERRPHWMYLAKVQEQMQNLDDVVARNRDLRDASGSVLDGRYADVKTRINGNIHEITAMLMECEARVKGLTKEYEERTADMQDELLRSGEWWLSVNVLSPSMLAFER